MVLRAAMRAFRNAWPDVRAVLVTLHCLAVALVACPGPSASSRLIGPDDPRFASEVHPWAKLLGVSDETFAKRAEEVRSRWLLTRALVVTPFERYLSAVGALQPWSLFSAPNRAPARFTLEVRSGGQRSSSQDAWNFLSGLPAGPWRRAFFESERVRSVLNDIGRSQRWADADAFCDYIGHEALREAADRAEARCQFVAVPTPSWRPEVSEHAAARVLYSRVVERGR